MRSDASIVSSTKSGTRPTSNSSSPLAGRSQKLRVILGTIVVSIHTTACIGESGLMVRTEHVDVPVRTEIKELPKQSDHLVVYLNQKSVSDGPITATPTMAVEVKEAQSCPKQYSSVFDRSDITVREEKASTIEMELGFVLLGASLLATGLALHYDGNQPLYRSGAGWLVFGGAGTIGIASTPLVFDTIAVGDSERHIGEVTLPGNITKETCEERPLPFATVRVGESGIVTTKTDQLGRAILDLSPVQNHLRTSKPEAVDTGIWIANEKFGSLDLSPMVKEWEATSKAQQAAYKTTVDQCRQTLSLAPCDENASNLDNARQEACKVDCQTAVTNRLDDLLGSSVTNCLDAYKESDGRKPPSCKIDHEGSDADNSELKRISTECNATCKEEAPKALADARRQAREAAQAEAKRDRRYKCFTSCTNGTESLARTMDCCERCGGTPQGFSCPE